GNAIGIKTFSRIANDNQNPAAFITAHFTLNRLGGIGVSSMHHRVGQRFIKRQLNSFFLFHSTVHLSDQLHNTLHHRVHAVSISSQSDTELQNQLVSLEVAD